MKEFLTQLYLLLNFRMMKSKITLITKKHVLIGLVLLSLSAYGFLLHETNQIDENSIAAKEQMLKSNELIPSIIVIKKIYETATHYIK